MRQLIRVVVVLVLLVAACSEEETSGIYTCEATGVDIFYNNQFGPTESDVRLECARADLEQSASPTPRPTAVEPATVNQSEIDQIAYRSYVRSLHSFFEGATDSQLDDMGRAACETLRSVDGDIGLGAVVAASTVQEHVDAATAATWFGSAVGTFCEADIVG